mmetsp:Transcript_15131/g.44628  ORF Transcript_15131/g.44628 Transcript_15131/m.44628 type:complete len:203 (-) Transcript_15131:136-744(-)
MDARRRNYTGIWAEMSEQLDADGALRSDRRYVVNVIGSGDREKLLLPAALQPRVRVQSGLRYGQFYDAVAASLALLPALASPAYLDRKFSSTVTTSLITGVPVIVPSEFLKAYAFLDARTVFLQREGETVMGAAARLAGLPAADVDALRARIASLREQLNANAAEVVTQVLAGTVEQPGRGPLREPADARFDMDGGVGSAGA